MKIKEGLFRVYVEFYVVASSGDEASECVALAPENSMNFQTVEILPIDATEEAISFMMQLMSSRVDDDQIEAVMTSYLKAKGLKDKPYLYYKDCIDAIRRAIKERDGEEDNDEED